MWNRADSGKNMHFSFSENEGGPEKLEKDLPILQAVSTGGFLIINMRCRNSAARYRVNIKGPKLSIIFSMECPGW